MSADGSLVSPLVEPSGEMYWVSKSSELAQVATHVAKCPSMDYKGLADHCANKGQTPLFEWSAALWLNDYSFGVSFL